MFETTTYSGNRAQDYAVVIEQARHLWELDLPLASNLATISALVKQFLDRTNWVGFYLTDPSGSQLVVGPFQGLPACTRIAFGKGVCGTAAVTRRTQRVGDVNAFPGHIACDSASRSEIVLPLIRDGTVLGVLDIDSPDLERFDALDQAGLEELAATLVALWPAHSSSGS
jgi:GAF domain-containing protein